MDTPHNAAERSQIPVLEHRLRRIPGVTRPGAHVDPAVDDLAVVDGTVPEVQS